MLREIVIRTVKEKRRFYLVKQSDGAYSDLIYYLVPSREYGRMEVRFGIAQLYFYCTLNVFCLVISTKTALLEMKPILFAEVLTGHQIFAK